MIRKPLSLPLLALCCAVGMSYTSPADAGVVVTIDGNIAQADITLGGTPGNPQYAATLYLAFDSPVGLSAGNLNITAQIVDPADPALLARLPGGGQVTVPANFPVLISVTPPAAGGFEFINAAQVDLYTGNLSYAANSPYRLYKAPAGGMFFDLTEDVLPGSIRCRSRTGGFSDFIMVADVRSAYEAAEDKYAFLFARVNDDDIDPVTREALAFDLDDSYEEFLEGDYEDAREELDELELRVDIEAGNTVPNRWRAAGDLDNVAGSLEGEAASLDFYLRQLVDGQGGGFAGGGDDDDDGGDDD